MVLCALLEHILKEIGLILCLLYEYFSYLIFEKNFFFFFFFFLEFADGTFKAAREMNDVI